MNRGAVDRIVRATLYEGYILYPYRATSVKNRVRWTFGGVFPRDFNEASGGMEPWTAQVECLLSGEPTARVSAQVRFLQPVLRVTAGTSREEAVEREVDLGEHDVRVLVDTPARSSMARDGSRVTAVAGDPATAGSSDPGGGPAAEIVAEPLEATAEISAEVAGPGLTRVRVALWNTTPCPPGAASREGAALRALVSTHVILGVSGGRWLSLADPPEHAAEAARACSNRGLWPILVGDDGCDDTVLASPIILEDHPRVAPESPGDLFDSTEIDEILSLRILTLSDEEKAEVRAGDARARAILERTESLVPEAMARLHGAFREAGPSRPEAP